MSSRALTFSSPISDTPGLSATALKMLEREGLHSVGELLGYLPTRHEDRRQLAFKGFAPTETPVCHHVRIVNTRVLRFGGRGGVFEAVVESASDHPFRQQLTLRWFNMVFLQRALAVDQELHVFGKIKEIKGRLLMDHPDYEVAPDAEESAGPQIHTGRVVPVYRQQGALKQKPLREAMWKALQAFDPETAPDLLPPPKSDGEFAGLSHGRALAALHFPQDPAKVEAARRYLALEEFYVLQLRLLRRRLTFQNHDGYVQNPSGSLLEKFLATLPFAMTGAQQRCLEEIRRDMGTPAPMNRLLHGDVGSGKTVVALAAMLVAVEAGQQAALMAPTQILAEQHYLNARRWLEPLGIRVALRTSDRKEDGSPLPLFSGEVEGGAEQGEPQLLVGTHALLYGDTTGQRLGLAVIDEQHKFGVHQRSRLISRDRCPDVLVMTATPIPRTLTLTVYGDLDVSTLDERPAERGKIHTAVRSEKKAKEVTEFLKEEIAKGRQCYLVYPLIDESEKLDAGAAAVGFEEWSKRLSPHPVGLLHGRMDSAAKDAVMRRFRAGELKALVSTTVIEVGVDVPNATVMVIHNAERFGLAQLHQLRGRIGRGTHTSYCVLFIPEKAPEAKERLAIMEETDDGFRIAEEDLRRRGPGDVLGQAQSGESPVRFPSLLADTRLVNLARRLAERTLKEDAQLSEPRHALLRQVVGEVELFAPALQ